MWNASENVPKSLAFHVSQGVLYFLIFLEKNDEVSV